MGIHESFQENPPGERDLNIHDIVIEKKEKEDLPFDPEREITDNDWLAMKEKSEEYHSNGDWDNFSRLALAIKIISRDRAEDLNLDQTAWRGIKYQLDSLGQRVHYWRGRNCQAVEMKILFPDQAMGPDLDKAWQEIKNQLNGCQNKRDWINLFSRAMDFSPLSEPDINFDQINWQEMRDQLDRLRSEEDWEFFPRLAMVMKIIAAKKIKITDKGIECEMSSRQKFHKKKTPRPERRQF